MNIKVLVTHKTMHRGLNWIRAFGGFSPGIDFLLLLQHQMNWFLKQEGAASPSQKWMVTMITVLGIRTMATAISLTQNQTRALASYIHSVWGKCRRRCNPQLREVHTYVRKEVCRSECYLQSQTCNMELGMGGDASRLQFASSKLILLDTPIVVGNLVLIGCPLYLSVVNHGPETKLTSISPSLFYKKKLK